MPTNFISIEGSEAILFQRASAGGSGISNLTLPDVLLDERTRRYSAASEKASRSWAAMDASSEPTSGPFPPIMKLLGSWHSWHGCN